MPSIAKVIRFEGFGRQGSHGLTLAEFYMGEGPGTLDAHLAEGKWRVVNLDVSLGAKGFVSEVTLAHTGSDVEPVIASPAPGNRVGRSRRQQAE